MAVVVTGCEAGPVDESGLPTSYRLPPHRAFETSPLLVPTGPIFDPADYDASNDDWAAFVAEVQRGLRAG